MTKKKLLFFTNSYPYGLGEMWKANELKYFVKYFDHITLIPLHYDGNFDRPKKLPDGVVCEPPLFKDLNYSCNLLSLRYLINKNLFYYMREVFAKRAYLNIKWFYRWLEESLLTQKLLKHSFIKELLKMKDENTVLYFYWGRGIANIVPFLNKENFSKIVVHMHRYDLWEENGRGYIPYRKDLLKSLTIAAPSSSAGVEHLKERYPEVKFDVDVFRCGVIGEGQAEMSNDNILRIITCSYLVPVKRVHILANALKQLDIPVEWTHLGDGPLMPEIKKVVSQMPSNVKVNLAGMIPSTDVLKYYIKHPVDLFINVSSSEGVPFSIMEAFSASIPVYATNVGGTSEIVDSSVGKLLSPDLSSDVLAKEIKEFYYLSKDEKLTIRQNAEKRYERMCNANILADEIASFLSK